MALITEKLAKWFKKPSEPSEKEMIKSFIGDLDDILVSMDSMANDMTDGFSEQIIKKRGFSTKLMSYLPQVLQPRSIRLENEKLTELKSSRLKMKSLRGTLARISNSVESMDLKVKPPENTEVGNRIYELAYPGEAISAGKVVTLEERLQILENSFLTSMDQLNAQLQQITSNLTTLTKRLDEQGVKIDQIDEKITEVDSKLQKIQSTLAKISKKLTQNRTLLALLAGSVIALVIVIVIL
ncbi:MAG: hypothetical protein ACXABI_11905 [Candidatus Hodarchaeales archaeon]|jgi:uncharacterized coiled-coil DUF342 family protein